MIVHPHCWCVLLLVAFLVPLSALSIWGETLIAEGDDNIWRKCPKVPVTEPLLAAWEITQKSFLLPTLNKDFYWNKEAITVSKACVHVICMLNTHTSCLLLAIPCGGRWWWVRERSDHLPVITAMLSLKCVVQLCDGSTSFLQGTFILIEARP